ncbi:unnamed protein product [Pseudo-nitzschia multistriata]|uniref:PH domain-containing protein n=1 Tax=Pseudo-nitzschia multistriata TaxID=183589 RepID=A0A448Z0A4_9STRA|nr:unnamed protein product [Pseudo-nitzschia multistriata]
MAPPSVVVVHSCCPGRDADLLAAALPRRFRSERSAAGPTLSFVSSSPDSNERILLVPAPSHGSASANENENDLELFETVSLATNHHAPVSSNNSNTNNNRRKQNRNKRATTSFACLVLDSREELKSMVEIMAGQDALAVEETKIRSGEPPGSSLPLAKCLLPGGCLVTLSVAPLWTTQELQHGVVEFMTTEPSATATPRHSGSPSLSSSNSARSKSSFYMKRSASMPEMVPPMVTTNNAGTDGKNHHNLRRKNAVVIPTLETKVLSYSGQHVAFPLNTQAPVPIETELFKGKLLLICRPSEDPAKTDPYWNERIFSKKKRRVVMQLQGKLKYKPTGTVFAGMEISNPMKLGLIANGLCNLILKLIKNQGLHYSFGTKDERAHICFPASAFFDSFVVTKPGEALPAMGGIDIKGESPETVAARKAYMTKIDWNTDDTYTMSFHSMYVDFPSWSVVSLPGGWDVPLQTFWGNSLASVVMYEVGPDADNGKPHKSANIKYLVSLQLKSLGKDAAAARLNAALLEQKDDGDETSEWGSEYGGGESISTMGDVALMPAFDEDDTDYEHENSENNGDEIDTTEFYDTIESLPLGETILGDLSSTSSHNILLSAIDAFCPCWIEMFSKRGKYETLYAFCGTKSTSKALFRSEEMAERFFRGERDEDARVDDRFSHRISTLERTRRILGWKYAEAHTTERDQKDHQERLQKFHKLQCRFDAAFLKRKEPSTTKVTGTKSGFVARALSDRHWKEERMVLCNNSEDILFHHAEGSKIHFRISLESVINVSTPAKDSELVPLPTYHYLMIESFVHVTYLMFRSKQERDSWLDTLRTILEDRRSTQSFTNELFVYDDPVQEFLTKSTMWNSQKRKILNCRRCSFRTRRSTTPKETLHLAERALAKVLSLKPKGASDSDLCEFLDCASALKEADAYSLNEEEKCAFFLNIYHTMIMHSYIIFGPPVSGTEWVSYFNNIAYQCSDDIFSIAELEHNVIRAKMSYPSNFLSRFVLPKSQYHFALVRPDFRLNFALNPGSLSIPTSSVPLYKAATLNQQLNKTTEEYLGYTAHVKQKGKTDVQITLPRVCQWFAEDFGPNGSASDVMFAIEPYLSNEKREVLRLIWNSKKKTYDISIFGMKYLSFSYECRFLTASSN